MLLIKVTFFARKYFDFKVNVSEKAYWLDDEFN